MKIPKEIVLKSALNQVTLKIEEQSATWAGRLAEKIEFQAEFTKKEFTDKQKENFSSAMAILAGKSQNKYNALFFKMSKEKQDDYTELSEYQMSEAKVNNAEIHMKTAMDKIKACGKVKKLIKASIAAQKK